TSELTPRGVEQPQLFEHLRIALDGALLGEADNWHPELAEEDISNEVVLARREVCSAGDASHLPEQVSALRLELLLQLPLTGPIDAQAVDDHVLADHRNELVVLVDLPLRLEVCLHAVPALAIDANVGGVVVAKLFVFELVWGKALLFTARNTRVLHLPRAGIAIKTSDEVEALRQVPGVGMNGKEGILPLGEADASYAHRNHVERRAVVEDGRSLLERLGDDLVHPPRVREGDNRVLVVAEPDALDVTLERVRGVALDVDGDMAPELLESLPQLPPAHHLVAALVGER